MEVLIATRTILKKSPRIRAKELVSEVKDQTGISRTTIFEHLHSLEHRGKIVRRRGRYWLPQSILTDKREALEHSKRLLLGLEAVLAEDWGLYRPDESSARRSDWKEKIETQGRKMKDYAIEHLMDDYLEVYKKLVRWQALKGEAKQSLLRDGNAKDKAEAVLNLVSHVGEGKPSISRKSKRILDQRLRVYQTLALGIRSITLGVEAGKPLQGTCRLCS